MDLKALLTISVADKVFANPKRIALLQQINACGSISQGAKLAGMSYKTAWDAVKDMNSRLPEAVVSSEKGGKGGGGAKLTDFGERLLQMYALTDQMQDMVLTALQDPAIPMNSLLDVMAHFSLKTSARNQLSGKITAMISDEFSDQIQVELTCGQLLNAVITHSSSQRLALNLGKSVLLLFKASQVFIVPPGADNRDKNLLRGTILQLFSSAQTTEVVLQLDSEKANESNQIVYVSLDTESAAGLDLKRGGHYHAVVPPEQVIVAAME